MLRLSIVIPALRRLELLENSLVSVLQNRPPHAEILIVHTEPYNDPYGLAGEVRFVAADRQATLLETANLGFSASRAPVVHLLGCGAEVTDGWTDGPLAHFEDSQVAAVSSLVLDLAQPQRALSTGVCYGRGGQARHRAAGRAARKAARARQRVLGPGRMAAFYRKSLLVQLGGFEPSVGDALADVDLALHIRRLGLECRFEPQSIVYAEQPSPPTRGFADCRAAERLFRRHAAEFGWASSLALHPLVVAGDMLRSLPRPAALTGLAGRLAAWLEGPAKRGMAISQPAEATAAEQKATPQPSSRRHGLRLDGAHPPRTRRENEKRAAWAPAQE